MRKITFLLILFLSHWAYAQKALQTVLNSGWSFQQVGKEKVWSATVPASMYYDLLRHGIIPDPFKGTNEKAVQWVEHSDWIYTRIIEIPEERLAYRFHELQMEGLDTYCDVYLNDVLLFKSGNAFRIWTAPVQSILKSGKNTLKLIFHSSSDFMRKRCQENTWQYPADSDQDSCRTSVFSRKPAMHYGWDFAPRLCGVGITGSVKLLSWNDFRLEDAGVYTHSIEQGKAHLVLHLHVVKSHTPIQYVLSIQSPKPTEIKGVIDENTWAPIDIPFEIQNPILWQTHDRGKPYLYHATLRLSNGQWTELSDLDFGIRTMHVRESSRFDSTGINGSSFYFELNGKPLFMKGVNMVPMDFVHAAKPDYKTWLLRMQDAHVNCVRIWGGGEYASESFYHLADSLGISVWQDLPFANSFYPDERRFNGNVNRELFYQTYRLLKHPSLALICGNNEIDVARKNWGWKQTYAYSDSIWQMLNQAYEKRFSVEFLTWFHAFSSYIDYLPTSPISNWGTASDFRSGDNHYWGIWHGESDIEAYRNHVGPFMSEYGFPSYPTFTDIRWMQSQEPLPLTKLLPAHMKSYKGNALLNSYLDRYYAGLRNDSMRIRASLILQGEALKTAIESHRNRAGFCMGSLYWQGNDFWPGTSWSILQFDGTPKPAYFRMKEAFAPQLLTTEITNDSLLIRWIATPENKNAYQLHVYIKNFQGEDTMQWSFQGTTSSSFVTSVATLARPNCTKHDTASVFVYSELINQNGDTLTSVGYFTKPKYQHLEAVYPEIRMYKDKARNIFRYELQSSTLIRGVYLEHPNITGFSNNGMDILPGKKVVIESELGCSISELSEKLQIHSINTP